MRNSNYCKKLSEKKICKDNIFFSGKLGLPEIFMQRQLQKSM